MYRRVEGPFPAQCGEDAGAEREGASGRRVMAAAAARSRAVRWEEGGRYVGNNYYLEQILLASARAISTMHLCDVEVGHCNTWMQESWTTPPTCCSLMTKLVHVALLMPLLRS